MNVVLAFEPDPSQVDPLSSVIRDELGAELVHVTSAYAAIVAANRRTPDLVLFGRDVLPEQRVKIVTHIRSLPGSSAFRTLDIPPLVKSAPTDATHSHTQDLTSFRNRLSESLDDLRSSEVRSPTHIALDAIAAEVEEARREAGFAAAREAARIKAETEAACAAALEEARFAADADATRRALEEEVARIKAGTEAQVQAAIARAREESETQIREEVARAKSETEARLEIQLSNVRGEAEQVRQAHQQALLEADRIRVEAAKAARDAAEIALAAESERIRAEAQHHLEVEVAALRARAKQQARDEQNSVVPASVPSPASSVLSRVPRIRWDLVRWDLVAAAAVLLLVIGAGVVWLPRMIAAASKTSSAMATTTAKAASATTRSVKKVTARVQRATRGRVAGSTRATAADRTEGPSTPRPAIGSGFLAAFSRIPMELYSDGRRIGTTEDGQLLLPAGRHEVEFVSERYHYRSSISVTIRPGKVTPHTLPVPTGQVRVIAAAGAEVWVDGERAGIAPINAVEVPIGTREVLVRDGSSGERRQTIEVRYGQTSEVTLGAAADPSAPPQVPHLAPLSQYQPR